MHSYGCRFTEAVPRLEETSLDLEDFCHSVMATTKRCIENIKNIEWLKSFALRMGTIYGLDPSTYIVSVYDNINDQSLSCTCVGVGRCHHQHNTVLTG